MRVPLGSEFRPLVVVGIVVPYVSEFLQFIPYYIFPDSIYLSANCRGSIFISAVTLEQCQESFKFADMVFEVRFNLIGDLPERFRLSIPYDHERPLALRHRPGLRSDAILKE